VEFYKINQTPAKEQSQLWVSKNNVSVMVSLQDEEVSCS